MALNRTDYLDLLRHLQGSLREADPEAFEVVAESFEHAENPRFTLLSYLDALIRVMAERSGGEHGRILNLVNRYIRTEEGGPVRGIRVEFTPEERELYGVEAVDLATLPDKTEFISLLRGLRNAILEEEGYPGDHDL